MLRSYRTKAAVLEEDVVVDKVLDLVVDALGVDGGTHGGGIAGHRYVAHHRHATPWNALVAQVDKSLTANQTVRLKKSFFFHNGHPLIPLPNSALTKSVINWVVVPLIKQILRCISSHFLFQGLLIRFQCVTFLNFWIATFCDGIKVVAKKISKKNRVLAVVYELVVH